MPILNYTTQVAAFRTASEVQMKLANHGATAVLTVFKDGEPFAVSFEIMTAHGKRQFQLPVNAVGVELAMRKQKIPPKYQGAAQARRVAWRILKDWVEAQLAIIESGMVALDEVMLPYMVTASGSTVSTEYQESAAMRAAIDGRTLEIEGASS